MRLRKAEYQNLFNAKVTAEKNYKIRERTSDFFGGSGDVGGVDIGTGVRIPRSNRRTQLPKHTTKPGRQAWAATGGKEGEAPCAQARKTSASRFG